MNRKQRRAAAKREALKVPVSQQKLIAGLYRNGITDKDLKAEFEKGANAGRCATIKTCYAAAALAAKGDLELDRAGVNAFIKAIDDYVCNTLSSEEIIDRVLEECGIRLDFHDPFGIVQ